MKSKGSTLKVPDRGRGGEASGRVKSMSWTPGRKLGASRPSRTLESRKRQKCLCFNTPDGCLRLLPTQAYHAMLIIHSITEYVRTLRGINRFSRALCEAPASLINSLYPGMTAYKYARFVKLCDGLQHSPPLVISDRSGLWRAGNSSAA